MRSRTPASVALLVAALLAACSTRPAPPTADASPPRSSPTGSAAKSASPTATGSSGPSSPGSASASPSPSDPEWRVPASSGRVTVLDHLDHPWSLAFLPDGSAFMTQRGNPEILRIFPGGPAPVSAGRITDVGPIGEGGMLGLALSPHFADDHRVFLMYTTATDNRVIRLLWDGSTLKPDKVLLQGLPRAMYHHGGRIAFGPDGYLYVATGDGKNGALAQDLGSPAGKVHRMDEDGNPAPGNPFPGSTVFTYGHRNVEGIAFDSAGRVVITELGENSVDEVNILEPGKNYGWPIVEGRGGTARGFVDPVATWEPTKTCSPSGAAFGDDGYLYVGCLAGQRVSRVRWNDGAPGAPETVLTDLGRIRAVLRGPDGRLWVLTDNGDDKIVVLPR